MSATEVKVPDIGDFADVPVIEILVSVGDEVAAEDPLVTLESDKATMDVPAPFAGVVKGLTVSVGDRVSEGSLLLTLDGVSTDGGAPSPDGAGAQSAAPAAAVVDEPPPPPAAAAADDAGGGDREFQVVVLGSVPAATPRRFARPTSV